MRCKKRYSHSVACLLLMIWFHYAVAQTDSAEKKQDSYKEKSNFSTGFGLQHGFIFAHSQAVQNTKGSNPTGLELSLGWQRTDESVWNLCNCYPRKGLLLAYYDYDNAILGKSFSAAYFLEPTYKLGRKLFFSFKGTAGLSYLTHPFDSISNPANQSYSTHLNAYLLVGLGLWIKVNQHWWINASVSYQHISNGGSRQPNKGINWPTAGLALSYQNYSTPFYANTRAKERFGEDYSLRWDVGFFGILRRSLDEQGINRRHPLIGLSLQASKQVGRINAVTLGIEGYRDEELRIRLKRDSIKASPVKSGILVGHEFLLGKFLFSQRLGFYIFDQTPFYDQLYHRWGLQFRANRRFGIGFNLLAHRQVADFIDLRLTYTVQKKYN